MYFLGTNGASTCPIFFPVSTPLRYYYCNGVVEKSGPLDGYVMHYFEKGQSLPATQSTALGEIIWSFDSSQQMPAPENKQANKNYGLIRNRPFKFYSFRIAHEY